MMKMNYLSNLIQLRGRLGLLKLFKAYENKFVVK